jgi:hypothetical protein
MPILTSGNQAATAVEKTYESISRDVVWDGRLERHHRSDQEVVEPRLREPRLNRLSEALSSPRGLPVGLG